MIIKIQHISHLLNSKNKDNIQTTNTTREYVICYAYFRC